MIEYGVEPFADIRDELPPLLREHWLKVREDDVPLAFDYDLFQTLNNSGCEHNITVRADHRLIGYAFIFTTPMPYSKGVLSAQFSYYYIRPTGRSYFPLLGRYRRLILTGQAEMRRLGARKIYGGVSAASDFGKLWESLGYHPSEHLYSRLWE